MKKLLKNVLEFYLTVGIPLFYGLVLYVIMMDGNSFPGFLIVYFEFVWVRLFFLGLSLVGIILWLVSYWYLRFSFGVLPEKKLVLVKSGPYKFLSHPMYVGIWLAFTGLGFANLSMWGLVLNWLVLTPINWWRGKKEKKLLFNR